MGPNSGAFTLNLENAPSNSNSNIGFRAALAYHDKLDISLLGLINAFGIRRELPVVGLYPRATNISEACDLTILVFRMLRFIFLTWLVLCFSAEAIIVGE